MHATTPAAEAAHELPLRFVGSGSEYFRIWIVNLLLTLLTLGLYYPFAKVRRLRYFYGATEVGGSPLSFHGDPWKMFRGYVLVALMLLAYTGAGHFSPTAGVVAFLLVAALWPALWHSSMRFRLANTGWRGLRFRYTGRLRGAYAVMGLPAGLAVLSAAAALWLLPGAAGTEPAGWVVVLAGLPALAILLLMPLFFWLLKRQQHAHLALGQEHSRFAAGPGRFYGLALKTALVGVLVVTVVVGLQMGVLFFLMRGAGDELRFHLLTIGVIGLAYLLTFALAGGYWVARLQNLAWNHTASQRLRFFSVLRAHRLAGLWFKNTLLVLLSLGLYFPFAQVASARMRLQAVAVLASVDPDELVASAAQLQESAAGDAAGDLFGFDIGL